VLADKLLMEREKRLPKNKEFEHAVKYYLEEFKKPTGRKKRKLDDESVRDELLECESELSNRDLEELRDKTDDDGQDIIFQDLIS
jgi:hypothetical protein